ncbi:hypothetical protein C8A01DRAFT_37037 [Parachaetomium inaequale]|uniref:Fork-head domain-containing protein n=1 Tax=Parachaetomium inaequale TaxID=2588326 RepID=A0AAN6PDJ8_9PEZI|nr:hypothetical protein C8A01DRAFT_37037 [Parachaetomium inaequale]
MAALSMGAIYASSPQQVSRASVSPDPTHVEHQLVAGMSALQSNDSDSHLAYMPSSWSGCLGSQTSSDEFDNYALHSSPGVSCFQQTSSTQSSPRSWDSPEQLGPTPWEAATEQLHNRYPGLDPQLSSYLHNGDIPTSFPADGVPFIPTQSFDGSDGENPRAQGQTEPYPAGYRTLPQDGYPSPPESGQPLSPCSTTLTLTMEDLPTSPGDDVNSQAATLVGHGTPSPARMQTDAKGEEPYAQLIYRAFLSTEQRAMTLQEIYQWFRDNTDKGKSESKGWQNSIRHNLSMNHAFTKRERSSSTTETGATKSSTQSETKKSTEWYLEPWAISGVQSTTRYRKGNQSRRSATSHGALTSRAYRSYPPHHHHSFGSRRGARVPRGARQSLRSNAAAATQPQLQQQHLQQHYPFSHAAATARGSPYIHHLINDPSSYFHHSPPQTQPHTNAETAGLEYDYPDPQLFPSSSSSSTAPVPQLARAASEPGASSTLDNEPVTPEPYHHSALPYRSAHHGHGHGHAHEAMLLPPGVSAAAELPFPTYTTVPVPGVYEEVVGVDQYHHHQQQQQQQQHQIQGWGGMPGMEGMGHGHGQCGDMDEGVYGHQGY